MTRRGFFAICGALAAVVLSVFPVAAPTGVGTTGRTS